MEHSCGWSEYWKCRWNLCKQRIIFRKVDYLNTLYVFISSYKHKPIISLIYKETIEYQKFLNLLIIKELIFYR